MPVKRLYLLIMVFMLQSCNEDVSPVSQEKPIRPAKIVTALKASASTKRSYPGTIEASNQSDLAFRVGGQLKALEAVPGKEFKKGDVLAELDDAEFVNQLADRRAKYKLAKSQHAKIKKLFTQKFASQAELDRSEADLRTSEAALSTAKDNLKYTKLLAPFDGQVALVNIDNFQNVGANQPIIQYYNSDFLDVRFSVPESLFTNIKPVADPSNFCLDVRFQSYPKKTYEACFKEFESVPDAVTRSYSAVHTMPRITDFLVLPGMTVTVEMDLSGMLIDTQSYKALVPIEAVFQKGGEAKVWRVKDTQEVELVTVETGPIHDQSILIADGIEAGDAIVAAGVSYLEEGTKVRPIEKERGL